MGNSLGSLRIPRCIGYESSWFRTSLSFPCGDPSLLLAGGRWRRSKGKKGDTQGEWRKRAAYRQWDTGLKGARSWIEQKIQAGQMRKRTHNHDQSDHLVNYRKLPYFYMFYCSNILLSRKVVFGTRSRCQREAIYADEVALSKFGTKEWLSSKPRYELRYDRQSRRVESSQKTKKGGVQSCPLDLSSPFHSTLYTRSVGSD